MADSDRSSHLVVERPELLIHAGIFFSTAVFVAGDDILDIGEVHTVEVIIFRERFIDADIMNEQLLLSGGGENFTFQIFVSRFGENIICDFCADRVADFSCLCCKIFVV